MFEPKLSMSFDINYNLEEIDRIKYRVERQLIMPKHEEWFRREAFIRTAYSSTMVEDATITTEEMEDAIKPYPASDIPKERPEIVNYTNALSFVDYLSDLDETTMPVLHEITILQIHWLLMKDIQANRLLPGKYRNVSNWISEQSVKVYEPPVHIDVPYLMREFSDWLSADEKDTEISPVIKAGIAHLHLVAVHPFIDGNGRTARLLSTLVLQRLGYGFRKLLSLDSFYQQNRNRYIDALKSTLGDKFTSDYDCTEWLNFFTGSILLQAQLLEQKLTDWRIFIEDIHRKFAGTGLSERQIDAMIYTVRMGYITRKYYAEITGVSLVTASRDLASLVARGLLKPEGKGRNQIYKME